MELFEKLGIDWRLLIAQIVNFLILMGALTYFLYKPLVAMLEKRRAKIAESLENAERIGKDMKRVETESARLIGAARAEAQRVVDQAHAQAEKLREETLVNTRSEVAAIIAQSKLQIEAERDQLMRAVRASAAELVTAAAEKVIGEKLTAERDRALVERIIETV